MKYENEQNIQLSYQVKNKRNPMEAEIWKLIMYLCTHTYLQQRRQEYTMEKRQPL